MPTDNKLKSEEQKQATVTKTQSTTGGVTTTYTTTTTNAQGGEPQEGVSKSQTMFTSSEQVPSSIQGAGATYSAEYTRIQNDLAAVMGNDESPKSLGGTKIVFTEK